MQISLVVSFFEGVMRCWGGFAAGIVLALAAGQAASAQYSVDYTNAEAAFENGFDLKLRQVLQVWLIVGGYSNAVPSDHFTPHVFKALQSFENANGFTPNGLLDKAQVERLISIIDPKLALWGMRRVSLPGHSAAVWVPFGLGLEISTTDKGFHYKDSQGRFALNFVSLPGVPVRAAYAALVAKKIEEGAAIHFKVMKSDWFVVSTTSADGTDHYFRYHQDGSSLTGFVMDWNNAAGNINAERIAVLDSAVLRATVIGAPFVDPPPPPAQATTTPIPPVQPAAVPVAPAPSPPQKSGFSTGTGFFVSEAGHFVTNAHVVKDCADVAVKTDDGAIGKAEVVATDVTNDLALLRLAKTPKRVVALRVGVRLGEGVEAYGFPHTDILATAGNFTLGNVSALSGLGDDSRYLQISAPVQAGNSGGPLLDTSGNLVGVVSMKLNAMKVAVDSNDLPQNVNFAIKSGTLANFLDANRVMYKVGAPAAVPLQPADIADAARAVSGFVVCR